METSDAPILAEAQVLADEIVALLDNYDGAIAGAALTMVFAFTILNFGKYAEDRTKIGEVLRDVNSLALKYGCELSRSAH